MTYLESEVSKMIKKIWRYIKIIMTFLMLFYVLYIIFVFTYYPKKMQAFCNSISERELISDVEKEVKNNNFKQYKNTQNKRLLVYDHKTIGKSTCTIYYKDNRQVYKKSYMND